MDKNTFSDLLSVGGRVRYARAIVACIDQGRLAGKIGLKQSAISSIESGRTKNTDKLQQIADACGVSYEWIMHGGDLKTKENCGELFDCERGLNIHADTEGGLARRFLRARKLAGLTQTEAAKIVGVAQNTVVTIENGVTSRSKYLPGFAKAFGVRNEWLATGNGDMCPKPDVQSEHVASPLRSADQNRISDIFASVLKMLDIKHESIILSLFQAYLSTGDEMLIESMKALLGNRNSTEERGFSKRRTEEVERVAC